MKNEPIKLIKPTIGQFNITLIGTSSLIMNALTIETMMGIKQPGQDNRNKMSRVGGEALSKEEQWERSRYYTKDKKSGFPLCAFKNAVLDVAKGDGWWPGTNISGKLLKATLQLVETNDDPIVEIKGILNKRQDIGRRPAKKTPSMIYRCEYLTGWECDLTIKFNTNLITQESICALINTAGYGVGVGDWRPGSPSGGSHGMFEIKTLKKS